VNPSDAGEPPRGDMRLISRAATILRALADQPSGLSLGQIARSTSLPRATVQRVVGALAAERFVVADGQAQGVRLGAELARIAASVHRDILGLCRPALERLNEAVQDTVDLTMLHGVEALVISQVPAQRPLRVVSQVGAALPLHCTASGKAHLSQLTRTHAAACLPPDLARYTANTCTDRNTVLGHPGVRATIFTDDEEFATGVCALALALPGLTGGNYAVAVSLPKQHFAERRAAIGQALQTCRADIQRAAGM
jgi:DNA-binding IclR family transcriptional regulator